VAQGTCSICGKYGRLNRGWCWAHYSRWRRHGNPLVTSRIVGDDRARFEEHVDRSGGSDACHPWTGAIAPGGYGRIGVNGKTEQAHAFGWELEHGPVPPGKELDHECHNQALRDNTCQPGVCLHRRCCNNRHLVLRTRKEHLAAAPSHPTAKLNEASVKEIMILLAAGESQREIGKRYGVTQMAVSAIKTGRNWSHVTQENQ
jgi:hypothetical protein